MYLTQLEMLLVFKQKEKKRKKTTDEPIELRSLNQVMEGIRQCELGETLENWRKASSLPSFFGP